MGNWKAWNIGDKRGYILLTASLMLIALLSVVLVSFFVLGHGADNDFRHAKTRLGMLEVRRALLGRMANAGENITACGGFISDYGEPDDMTPFGPDTDNFIGVILNRQSVPAWQGWSYSGPPEEFWAGYRGKRYIIPPPGEWSDNPLFPHDFLDGWGYPIEVKFIEDATPEHTVIEIRSNGSGGVSGENGNYEEDVTDMFYWKRSVNLRLILDVAGLGLPDGTDVDIEASIVYPFRGSVIAKDETLTITINGGMGSGAYDFPIAPPGNPDPQKFPVGSRKTIFILKTDLSPWGGPVADTLLAAGTILIPAYPVASDPPEPPGPHSTSLDVVI